MTIEKTITSIDYKNMELLNQRKEITRLQSEMIKENKLIDAKLDSNIIQKLGLEKWKYMIFPNIQVPLPSTSQSSTAESSVSNPSTPQKSVSDLPCIIKKARRSLDFMKQKSTAVTASTSATPPTPPT